MNPIQIISASAGSGKTYRLTELLEQGVVAGGVRPRAVLATTFTNKSAAELQERVRVRLLKAGRTSDAHQLTAARMGTVNSVCGRLVTDYAFELGLSPQLRVLDEEPAGVALRRAVSAVITPEEEAKLSALGERMGDLDWQKAVGDVVGLARSNGIAAGQLAESASRSVTGCLSLFGAEQESAASLDAALLAALEKFLRDFAQGTDATSGTKTVVSRARIAAERLGRGIPLAWKDWVGLAKAKPTKASAGIFEPVRVAAAAQDRHPRLHADVRDAIELLFRLAARTLESYQAHKREMGAIDFVDQESLALGLLARPDVREQLAGELDLVLIDEFQDTSPIQLAIFLRLAETATRSVWVGDQKQAVYGFRGADPVLMDAAIEHILQGREPETLATSYRSRGGLVHFTSALFTPAFGLQGIPASRVELRPANEADAPELGTFLEYWELDAKNETQDAASLAAGVHALLNDPASHVRDRKDDLPRAVRASDVAVLCRQNDTCLKVAEQLDALGIRAVLPRQGLLSTYEGRVALAGLRCWVDGGDSLAAAELARLTDYADREDDWLKDLLERPGGEAFFALPALTTLRAARDRQPALGVLGAFDAVVASLALPELCLRWGDAEARVANLEALRSHVVQYMNGCATDGAGCTAAGLVAYLGALSKDAADSQGINEDDHAVVVSTWHGAKGLEWPIVVLFPLSRADRPTQALGIKVQNDRAVPDLADPLAARWIRFWPNPYDANNNGMPFHDRLAEHPATAEALRQSEREDLRLLYVGWTRAKDRVVLASRKGKLTDGLLSLLRDARGPLINEPAGSTVTWAGRTVPIVVRQTATLSPQRSKPKAGTGYAAAGAREFPAAFVQPSGAAGSTLQLSEYEQIGARIGITGDPVWGDLGTAIHTFLCADRPGLAAAARERLLNELLEKWQVRSAVDAGEVLRAADSLVAWVGRKWPRAVWHREWPVLRRDAHGSVTRGSSDLVLETADGLVVIDHKSFPGSIPQALERAARYTGQLKSYAEAIQTARGRRVLGTWVHLPVSGIVVPLPGGN